MATIDYANYDFLAGAVENQEYERSPWRTDQRHFARSERRVITVYKRDMDDSHDVTLFALENVIAMIVFSEHYFRFGEYKQWEADFLRHLLGHTTFEEEHEYNESCNRNIRLCDDHSSIECRIGKKLTALLRHNSPLKKHMYSNGAVELRHVLDICNPDVNPYDKFHVGRLFAAFIQGNNKQRYFIEVSLNDDWFMGSSKLPWKIFIGCNQGHTTGIVRAVAGSLLASSRGTLVFFHDFVCVCFLFFCCFLCVFCCICFLVFVVSLACVFVLHFMYVVFLW